MLFENSFCQNSNFFLNKNKYNLDINIKLRSLRTTIHSLLKTKYIYMYVCQVSLVDKGFNKIEYRNVMDFLFCLFF